MMRILFHPLVLFLIALAALGIWMWVKRVDLRIRLTRPPTQQEWAIVGMFLQLLRWLLRLRL